MKKLICLLLLFPVLCWPKLSHENHDAKFQLTNWVMQNSHKKISATQARNIVTYAFKASLKHDVDPFLLLALMKVESGFVSHVVSDGAIGLTQIVPKWHPELLNIDLTNPEASVFAGAHVFSKYLKISNGRWHEALLRYNGSFKSKNPVYHTKVIAVYHNLLSHTLDS